MPKEKIKIKIEFIVTLLIVLPVTVFTFWSAWYGLYHSETGVQQLATNFEKIQPNDSSSDSSDIVFLGDSLTAREDWNVLFGVDDISNAGQSGNTTDDVLARLNSVLAEKPQKIFLMIGINDFLRGKDVPYVLANYYKIISQIESQSPGTQIYIQSILPTNNSISQIGIVDSEKIITLNDKLSALADGRKIFFLSLYPNFCGPDDQMYVRYTNDGVHLNAVGYTVWKNSIVSYLK